MKWKVKKGVPPDYWMVIDPNDELWQCYPLWIDAMAVATWMAWKSKGVTYGT